MGDLFVCDICLECSNGQEMGDDQDPILHKYLVCGIFPERYNGHEIRDIMCPLGAPLLPLQTRVCLRQKNKL